jgi:hypothetical protein
MMTTDEIIDKDEVLKMAREAASHGVENHRSGEVSYVFYNEHLMNFAKLVDAKATAKEREACAKLIEVSDDVADWEIICGSDGRVLLNAMAEAIRARGEA